jgi:hypothetical protein
MIRMRPIISSSLYGMSAPLVGSLLNPIRAPFTPLWSADHTLASATAPIRVRSPARGAYTTTPLRAAQNRTRRQDKKSTPFHLRV